MDYTLVFKKLFDYLEDAERAVMLVRSQLHKEYTNHG